jgi:hypothetical protein
MACTTHWHSSRVVYRYLEDESYIITAVLQFVLCCDESYTTVIVTDVDNVLAQIHNFPTICSTPYSQQQIAAGYTI